MTNSTDSTCPTWCEKHTTEEGITYHEANVDGGGWDLILTHEATREGTTIGVGLRRDPLSPSDAFALGVALVEAAATVGQAEAEQQTGAGATAGVPPCGNPFADLLASELRRGGWSLSRMGADDHPRIAPSAERVRRTYAYREDSTPEGFKAAGEAFDAWLAAHDAELLASNRTTGA